MSTLMPSQLCLMEKLERLEAENARLRQQVEELRSPVALGETTRQETAHFGQELDLLAKMTRLSQNVSSLERTASAFLRTLHETLHPDLAFIFLRWHDRLILHEVLPPAVASEWRDIPEHKVGECLCGLAVSQKGPIYSRDIESDPRCTWKECKMAGVKSFAALPLFHDNEIWGVVGLGSFAERDFAAQGPFLEVLSAQLAVAVAHARTVEQLRQELAERERTEQTLRQSELHFRALVEESPLGIALINQKGIYEYLNPSFVKIFGYTMADLTSREEWFRLAFPDPQYRAEVTQLWFDDVRSCRQGKTIVHTLTVTCKNRQTKNIMVKAVFIPPGKFFVLYEDVSEQLRAEEEIRNREATLHSILQSSASGVSMCSFPDRTLLWVNQRMCQITGFSQEELLNMPARKLYPNHEEYRRVGRLMGEQLKAHETGSLEAQWMRKDGSLVDVLLTVAPVKADDFTAGLVFTSLDITESKRAREQLLASEEKFRLVMEASPYPVVLYDTMGRVLYLNPAFTSVFGWTQEELLGNQIDYVPQEEYSPTTRRLEDMKQGRNSDRFETRRLDKAGNLHDVVITWTSWKDSLGEFAGSMVVLRDVTEHNKMLTQLEKARRMETIGTLAGGIAHDFNNVLQAISGNVQLLLLRSDLTGSLRETLSGVDGLTQRASEMIQQLLTISRGHRAQLKPVDLNEEIRQICRLIERIIPRMVRLELRLAPDLQWVQADAAQWEQVMLNLAGNATQAMPEGGTFTVTTENLWLDEHFCQTHHQLKPGHHVLLTVADTGTGMDAQTLEHIFEPFFTTKKEGQGTGLGLATVYGIVQQHQGLITCYSTPGQGTMFKIYLPALPAPGAGLAPKPDATASQFLDGHETVLLVDDEEIILNIGSEIMDMHGYKVMQASSGEEALEIYSERGQEIDLVILDLNMPGMGGKRCLELMLGINPAAKIIISSGYSTPSTAEVLLEAGAAGFIGKPYRLADMVGRVREVLDSIS